MFHNKKGTRAFSVLKCVFWCCSNPLCLAVNETKLSSHRFVHVSSFILRLFFTQAHSCLSDFCEKEKNNAVFLWDAGNKGFCSTTLISCLFATNCCSSPAHQVSAKLPTQLKLDPGKKKVFQCKKGSKRKKSWWEIKKIINLSSYSPSSQNFPVIRCLDFCCFSQFLVHCLVYLLSQINHLTVKWESFRHKEAPKFKEWVSVMSAQKPWRSKKFRKTVCPDLINPRINHKTAFLKIIRLSVHPIIRFFVSNSGL